MRGRVWIWYLLTHKQVASNARDVYFWISCHSSTESTQGKMLKPFWTDSCDRWESWRDLLEAITVTPRRNLMQFWLPCLIKKEARSRKHNSSPIVLHVNFHVNWFMFLLSGWARKYLSNFSLSSIPNQLHLPLTYYATTAACRELTKTLLKSIPKTSSFS